MAVAGQLLPMPTYTPERHHVQERGLVHRLSLPETRRSRVYRIPRSGDWVSDGVYGPDGRFSANLVTGLRIDLSV